MFDLEKAIADWRRQMEAANLKPAALMDELENHLREETGQIRAAGVSDMEAFRLAVERLGSPRRIAAEFNRSSSFLSGPLLVGASVWGIGLAVLAVGLFSRWAGGGFSSLLMLHIWSLTAGYSAAFLAGGFGVYAIGCRQLRRRRPGSQPALQGTISLFTGLAAGLTLAGFLLGMIWSELNRGQYLTGDPREIGALGAALWLVASSLIQRDNSSLPNNTVLLSIVGNMVIGLAWFGAGILVHGYGNWIFWLLNLLLGGHLLFLLLGFLPVPEAAGTRKEHYV